MTPSYEEKWVEYILRHFHEAKIGLKNMMCGKNKYLSNNTDVTLLAGHTLELSKSDLN